MGVIIPVCFTLPLVPSHQGRGKEKGYRLTVSAPPYQGGDKGEVLIIFPKPLLLPPLTKGRKGGVELFPLAKGRIGNARIPSC